MLLNKKLLKKLGEIFFLNFANQFSIFEMILQAAKFIGAGLSTIFILGSRIGIGIVRPVKGIYNKNTLEQRQSFVILFITVTWSFWWTLIFGIPFFLLMYYYYEEYHRDDDDDKKEK